MSTFQQDWLDLRSDYVASKESRFLKAPQGIHQQGSSGDFHYRNQNDFYYMVELGRHITRNDQIVGQGVRTFVKNVIQGGFNLKPETPDKELNRSLKKRWDDETGDEQLIDVGGEFDFHAFERCATGDILSSGDIMFSPTRLGQMQVFEAHRCRSPEYSFRSGRGSNRNDIVLGVEKLPSGRRHRYWMTKTDYDGINNYRRFTHNDLFPIDAYQFDSRTQRNERNLFHVYCPQRYSQSRGVTPLAPVMVTAGMHDDVQYAKMIQQQLCSYFAIVHNFDVDAEPVMPKDVEKVRSLQRPGYEKLQATHLHPGAEIYGQPGETIQGFSPGVPNAEFFDHSRMLLTFIAVNLDLPLILFLMDASETNFSGWRGAFDQAKLRFKDFQRELAKRFHSRVYRWKLRQWIAQDRGLATRLDSMGTDLFKHTWHFPRWPYIEPEKDIQANYVEMKTGQNSPRRVLLRNSLEWETIMDETVEDRGYGIKKAMEKAKELNVGVDPEDRVSWREIVSFDLPVGFQMKLPQDDGSSNDANNQRRPAGRAGETQRRQPASTD